MPSCDVHDSSGPKLELNKEPCTSRPEAELSYSFGTWDYRGADCLKGTSYGTVWSRNGVLLRSLATLSKASKEVKVNQPNLNQPESQSALPSGEAVLVFILRLVSKNWGKGKLKR